MWSSRYERTAWFIMIGRFSRGDEGVGVARAGSRRSRVLAVVITCVFALGGCAAGGSEAISDDNPYAKEFRQAYEGAPDDFTKGVLEDGRITESEALEYADRRRQCYVEKGLMDVTINVDGSASWTAPPSIGDDGEREITSSCDGSWNSPWNIVNLYVATRDNPENKNRDEAVATCLRHRNVVPDDFSVADYKTMVSDSAQYAKWMDGISNESSPDYDADKAAALEACLSNPF